jgi:hypothetical protein
LIAQRYCHFAYLQHLYFLKIYKNKDTRIRCIYTAFRQPQGVRKTMELMKKNGGMAMSLPVCPYTLNIIQLTTCLKPSHYSLPQADIENIARKIPDIARKIPEFARRTPEFARKIPSIARKTPEFARKIPDFARGIPEIARKITRIAS